MAQGSIAMPQESLSNDNSISTKEFLNFEKTCDNFQGSDEEIRFIFSEITRLSAGNHKDNVIAEDVEDVEIILKRAEDLSQETEKLLKDHMTATALNTIPNAVDSPIPQIKVTKPVEKDNQEKSPAGGKAQHTPKHKENVRRKPKVRPFSAGVIDSKRRDTTAKTNKVTANSPKKTVDNETPTNNNNSYNNNKIRNEEILEELKNTNERVKSLELLNVQLTGDNKALKKKLYEITEEKHVTDLKLVECEKYLGRLSKQFENKHAELNTAKENESKYLAELNKERNERKNLTLRHEKDAGVIQDLQRQVKEMEMILRRKHPDSVSALIVASKASTVEDNKKKLLEERIMRLEKELKDKEDHFQGILLTLQEKFGDMKQKYENHIIDVERQLMEERKVNIELKNKLNKTQTSDASVQGDPVFHRTISTQTSGGKPERAASAVVVSKITPNSALLHKLKEDSYLVATIKGMQAELTTKQRTIAKINRETEELRKNLRSLQKEKEMLLNINPQQKKTSYKPSSSKSTENILTRMNTEMEAELEEARKQKEGYMFERNSLLDSLKRTNEEFILLKKKRIQDLHTLQVAHEKELMQMNMQLYPLQEEIKFLNRTVEILQERIRVADEKLLRLQGSREDISIQVHAGGDTMRNGCIKKDKR